MIHLPAPIQKQYIEGFLEEYSGRIIAVGDTFDLKRSSVVGETGHAYLKRTEKWHQHIKTFIKGNHDYDLLTQNKNDRVEPALVRHYGPALCFHGHQLTTGVFTKKERLYLKKWNGNESIPSLYEDVKEWMFTEWASKFTPKNKGAKRWADRVVDLCAAHKLIQRYTRYIIFGHFHLPFIYDTSYSGIFRISQSGIIVHRTIPIRIINLGSALRGNVFNPVYVREIDKWFVSDLHLGCKKSVLDDEGEGSNDVNHR